MKTKNFIKSFFILSIILIISCNQTEKKEEKSTLKIENTEIKYDSIKAKKFGTDDYGMKKIVIAFLYRGPNRDLSKEEKNKLQRAHLDYINKLAEAGKLVLAGPFFGKEDLRGIYIFDVQSIEEAENLTKTDPAIIAGSLKMDLKEWYGSAALMAINDLHSSIAKVNP